jgi:hypothetical protein
MAAWTDGGFAVNAGVQSTRTHPDSVIGQVAHPAFAEWTNHSAQRL